MIRNSSILVIVLIGILSVSVGIGHSGQQAPGEQAKSSRNDSADLIELLQQKGVITEQEAVSLKQRTKEPIGNDPSKGSQPVSPSDNDQMVDQVAEKIQAQVSEKVKNQIKSEMTESDENWLEKIHVSVPEWTRRLRWNGDVRLRYEGIFFNPDNAIDSDPSDPSTILNTTNDRNRFRYRARLGLMAEVTNQVDAGFRLTTGNTGDPVSTNETVGDYFNKDSIVLDQAYIKIQPVPSLPETNLWGGRMPNPFFATDLVWDGDVQFEGLAMTVDFYATNWFRPFITGGWFPIQEEEWHKNKYMSAGQLGFEVKPRMDLILTVGAAYYDFQHIQGIANDPENPNWYDYTAPQFYQKGNTYFSITPEYDDLSEVKMALAGEYRLINITGQFDIALFHPVHIILMGDYVENIAFDWGEIAEYWNDPDYANEKEENVGWDVGIAVGHPSVRNFSEWNVAFHYRYLEADAVLDAFTDSDFHLGGTNAEGWMLTTQFGLTKNTWLVAKWSTSDEIHGLPNAVDVLQVDLNAKF